MAEIKKTIKEIPGKTVLSVQIILMRERENNLEVFLGYRNDGSFLNQWSFPGGTVNNGESNEQAACREIFEETGIEVNENRLEFLLDTVSSTVRDINGMTVQYDYRIKVFTLEAQELSPFHASEEEHSEMIWFTLPDALSMHRQAVLDEQALGVSRSPDKIPNALAPQTLKTIEFLLKAQKV
ncbi:MAG: nudix hydrolase [Candidatus Gottesmanbacteria bacterium GW2011_GWA2_43_14]|uniref:Nudix hydrolase n=1 Tax=Candidatus Gottesmanbacteria bacterium GW2011_GWA2_43_14 TaxID=1618443 RepID=A0A0G1DLM1_9BACT|nr:MAG: nudix hydrolase [Candidatus Gottesmanbacteria bacterium GW2011_GWA2_43_14]